MQPGGAQSRSFQSPASGMLDFGRFPPAQPSQGRQMGYPDSYMEDQGYGMHAEAASRPPYGSSATAGAYSYLGGQAAQPSFVGAGFPTAKPPPTFPPPQPPAAMAPGSTAAATADAGFGFQKKEAVAVSPPAAGRLGQQDISRVLHTQPPPPPSQAPQVLPSQTSAPQGPPSCAPPLMSPPAAPAPASNAAGGGNGRWAGSEEIAEDLRKREELLYLKTPEAEKAAREKYGLLGILKVIRMTDPDLNMLALGMDLTTLGLNLNSPECLYSTFASPWSDTPARKDPDFFLPQCYYMNPPQLKQAHLQKFSLETLFYIFFNMPRDTLQAYAAAELYNRGWKYHRDLKTWFIYQEEEGQPRWVCFDLNTWEKHYYMQEVNVNAFLSEDDVRVKMPPPGQMPAAAPASG